MKQLISTFCFFIFTHALISQTVTSSCTAPDSIKALYMADADRLALKRIYQQNLPYTNNIVIPQAYTDTVLKALIAVYNATALPARNAVVSMYNVHTFPNPVMNQLNVAADSTLPWMNQLKLGNIPTGNAQIDNLLSTYSLTIQNYNRYFGIMLNHVVTFKCDSNYNIGPLTGLFSNIPTVAYSETVSVVGSGNDIGALIYPTHVQLIYSIGWGDCPSGCIYRHYWKFNVYHDCTVEFVGESGAAITPAPAPSISVSGTYCANATLTVTISGANTFSLNNQPASASQFTLSSPTPTTYTVWASYNVYPSPVTTTSVSISIIGCGASATSIDENNRGAGISVYPNPADDFIELKMTGQETQNAVETVSIYNSLGQRISYEEPTAGNSKIKTGALSCGMYSLEIKLRTGETLSKRFVVSR